MRVRLTKKLAERIDGVDLSRWRVGQVLDLPLEDARLLLAEQWATLVACGAGCTPEMAAPEPKRKRFG